MDTEKESWVSDTLGIADKVTPTQAPIGFYERALNRLTYETSYTTGLTIKIAASVLLLIGINVLILVNTNVQASLQQRAFQTFANEYLLTGNYYYNY